MRRHPLPRPILATAAIGATLTLAVAACGDDAPDPAAGPTVVVTTSILGDVASELVGHDATVTVIVPAGADPHEFQPSARQAAEMQQADLLVVNGGGFEAGLQRSIDRAADDGVAVFTALDHVDTLPAGTSGDGHDHGGVDPHVFTDPARMAVAAGDLADALAAAAPEIDTPRFRERADAYVAELHALDREVADTLASVPDDRRVLVATHDVLAYFADRYGFELLGSVLPSQTTEGTPSAAHIDALARAIDDAGVTTIFADASAPTSLADTLSGETGVEVVELASESLGQPGSGTDTYIGMMRTNAERIATALG